MFRKVDLNLTYFKLSHCEVYFYLLRLVLVVFILPYTCFIKTVFFPFKGWKRTQRLCSRGQLRPVSEWFRDELRLKRRSGGCGYICGSSKILIGILFLAVIGIRTTRLQNFHFYEFFLKFRPTQFKISRQGFFFREDHLIKV